MITKNKKIMIKALPIMAFLTSISAVAKTTYPQVLQQEPEGPEAPPGVPIDSYLLLLLAIAVIFAGVMFFKNKKRTKTIF